jgi:hypothetical protein
MNITDEAMRPVKEIVMATKNPPDSAVRFPPARRPRPVA